MAGELNDEYIAELRYVTDLVTHSLLVFCVRFLIFMILRSERSIVLSRFCRQVFTLFDRNNDQTMNPRDLMAALKALGQNPSQEETRNLVNQVRSFSRGIRLILSL